MDLPSAQTLLELWERGQQQPLAYRALMLLAAAVPETTLEGLAQLSIGERNRQLLLLRQQLFGARLASVTDCPMCGARLELSLEVSELLAEVSAPEAPVLASSRRLRAVGYSVEYRLPNSLDLLNLPEGDTASARRFLLSSCVLGVKHMGDKHKGERVMATALPNEVQQALSAHMAEADPQALTELKLHCPACEHVWSTTLDIASFLWRELEHWAKRLLRDVHRLASAYGWCEADILSMSPWRRQVYLELMSR